MPLIISLKLFSSLPFQSLYLGTISVLSDVFLEHRAHFPLLMRLLNSSKDSFPFNCRLSRGQHCIHLKLGNDFVDLFLLSIFIYATLQRVRDLVINPNILMGCKDVRIE